MSFDPECLQIVSRESFTTAPTPVAWLWDGFLAEGMISLMTSRWKAGKTTLLSVMLSQLDKGATCCGSLVTPGRSIILSEEPLALWHDRHARLDFGPEVHWSCRPFRSRPTFEQWSHCIAALAARQPRLVIIDPLAMFLPGTVENNASALLDALQPLHALTAIGAAVLLVHHPKKGPANAELSPRGTGALTGFADILIDLDRPLQPDFSDRVRRLSVTSRLRANFRRHVELTEDGRDYAVLPEPPDTEGFDAGWPVLKMVLEDSESRATREQILKSWPQDYDKPSLTTLRRWLTRALTEGTIDLRGNGRHHNPYTYYLKGQQPMLGDLEPLEPLHYRYMRQRQG